MKELILIPKYIYEQGKNTQPPKEKKLKTTWKTKVPPIPLRPMNVENILNNKRDNKKEVPLSDKLAIHFNNATLSKAKQLLKHFENKSGYNWDNDGNIQNQDKNLIDIIHDFLSIKTPLDNDTLEYYKYLIFNLNIPPQLIRNRFIKPKISDVTVPSWGKRIKGGSSIKWDTF